MSSTIIEDVCSTCGKFVRRSNMARHLKAHTVKNFLCFYTSHIKKENFNKRKEYLHKNKQVPNKDAPYAMAACTTNNIVNALENAIEKDKETFKF